MTVNRKDAEVAEGGKKPRGWEIVKMRGCEGHVKR